MATVDPIFQDLYDSISGEISFSVDHPSNPSAPSVRNLPGPQSRKRAAPVQPGIAPPPEIANGIPPDHPPFFLPLVSPSPRWFLYNFPFIAIYDGREPPELEPLSPSIPIEINATSLIIHDLGNDRREEISMSHPHISQIVKLRPTNPVLNYITVCELVGSSPPPTHFIGPFLLGSLFTPDLLVSLSGFSVKLPDDIFAAWFDAAQPDFQSVYERLIRAEMKSLSNISNLFNRPSFALSCWSLAFRFDASLQRLIADVLRSPGDMKSDFIKEFAAIPLTVLSTLVLWIAQNVSKEVFGGEPQPWLPYIIVIRAGIIPQLKEAKLDPDLAAFGLKEKGTPREIKYPAAYRKLGLEMENVEGYITLVSFLNQHLPELKSAAKRFSG
jgi:hypothetical protein